MKSNTEQPNVPESKTPKLNVNEKEDLKSLPMSELEKNLGSSPDRLTQAKAQERLTQYGPNEIEEKKSVPKISYLFFGDSFHGGNVYSGLWAVFYDALGLEWALSFGAVNSFS